MDLKCFRKGDFICDFICDCDFNHNVLYSPINNIPQCNSFVLLGVALQSNGKFNEHVRTKLVKANKCLHILRTLRKEHYSQAEIDHLFISIV